MIPSTLCTTGIDFGPPWLIITAVILLVIVVLALKSLFFLFVYAVIRLIMGKAKNDPKEVTDRSNDNESFQLKDR